jgi:hypothetical protein
LAIYTYLRRYAVSEKRWQEPRRLGTPPAQIACWRCYLVAQHNSSIEDTEVRLLEVSEKPRQRVRHRDTGYVLETVLNASAHTARDLQRMGGA